MRTSFVTLDYYSKNEEIIQKVTQQKCKINFRVDVSQNQNSFEMDQYWDQRIDLSKIK